VNRVAEVTPSDPQPARRVCVIDDCEDFRELLVQLLAGLGWEVSAFESGREALAELGALNPDLILLDIRMPGLDGIQCAERIRTRLPRARIVLMTAGAFIEEQRRGCQAMGRLPHSGLLGHARGR
jgi:CheY-like chemotaxis protein